MFNQKILLENAPLIKDGDELRNINCHDYLSSISNAITADDRKKSLIPINIFESAFTYLTDNIKKNEAYAPLKAYGNIYTGFHERIESAAQVLNEMIALELDKRALALENLKKEKLELVEKYKKQENKKLQDKKKLEELAQEIENLNKEIKKCESQFTNPYTDSFIESIQPIIYLLFANPNKSLERSGKMVEDVIQNAVQTSSQGEKVIRSRLKGNSTTLFGKFLDNVNYFIPYRNINVVTPERTGSDLGCAISNISPTFKPLSTTSMPTIKEYDYKKVGSYPLEYRFGTQGQYHNGVPRISPTFSLWLYAEQYEQHKRAQEDPAIQNEITHIYFNNLGLDRNGILDQREVILTKKLHELEAVHSNLAVITLPADKGILNHHFLEHHEKNITCADALERMFKLASGQSEEAIKDFNISEKVKKLLYGENGNSYNKEVEKSQLQYLLRKSFSALGLSPNKLISEAELQAVYFHFIKFELADFIIKKLDPKSFNFSCKDGIDRAGVSSAYYNLIKSIESGHPMSQEEFTRALHAAPTLVKGRGLNAHSKLIWNAVNAYINGHSSEKRKSRSVFDMLNELDLPDTPPTDIPGWLIEWRDANAPQKTHANYIKKLNTLIENESKLGKGMFQDKGLINTAIELIKVMKNERTHRFQPNEWKYLHQSKLEKIFSDMVKNKLIDEKDYQPSSVTRRRYSC